MNRVFHTWDKWECYQAGFYEDVPPGDMDAEAATDAYAAFLRDIPRFSSALDRVLAEWPNSCEHYLSNENMNRIAWLGQSAMCIETRVPAAFRRGYHKLSDAEKQAADACALVALNRWLVSRGEPELSLDNAASKTKPNLY